MIALVGAGLSALSIAANRHVAVSGGTDLSILALPTVAMALIGLGLWKGWRLAAVLFSLTCASAGAWLIVGSLLFVDMTAAAINISAAAMLMVPAIETLRCWHQLAPKTKSQNGT